ncbi:NAD(P)-binding protein [Setomelanomma holmii]|uniref:NAD(P)-binding protein n=1 Tax=Setomelanomma holmii TaxID=210430 RepID=A0A9P4LI57_9PLEO|nr:NAD(P)-binding protein [Setomelanomma holmii]
MPKIIATVGVTGITRDPSKPSTKKWGDQGVELVAGRLDDKDSLLRAFQGANVIFGFTDFWHYLPDPNNHKGKAIVDAVAANVATLDRLVLSTCSDARKWSNGDNKWVLHFDAKAEAVKYLESTYPELWAKTSLLQLGYYVTNWRSFVATPKKLEDGSFKVSIPVDGDRKIHMVNPAADAGSFVKALVELLAGRHLVGAGSYISFNEWCDTFSKVNGRRCVFERMADRNYEELMGPVVGLELEDMFKYFDKYGYDGVDPSVLYPRDLRIGIKYTTVRDFMKREDWTSIM